jgi:hypothetical protein
MILRTWFFLIASLSAASLAVLPFAHVNQSSSQSQPSYSSHVQLVAKRAPVDFLPDGDLAKDVWKQAEPAKFDQGPSGKSHYREIATTVACLWTETYIYFGFSGRYQSLNVYEGEDAKAERWKLWERDVVEVFLNPLPERVNHYYEFEVAPNNQWIDLEIDKTKDPFNDASWNSGFAHATRVDAKNHIWTAEMRIPLSSMNVAAIHQGMEWRANFFRAAGSGGDEHRKFLVWSSIPEGKTFHVPTRFGILKLVN